MRNSDKQTILEERRPLRRLEKLHRLLDREVEILALDNEIQSKAREQMSDQQRDYYLREQMKAIQNELGEGDGADEFEEYRQKIAKAALPDEVREKLTKELNRLTKQPFGSSEATVLRSYLDVCLELPWGKYTKEKISVPAVRRVLDQEHYGLDKVKERILEFVAVKQLAPALKGQVLCLVGPPGVGKTSIAMSMAKAMNRKLARLSLGGVSDEAEIRGHRKTYVGAMPGRIITAIQQAGSCNPLILLDEIDKLGRDHRGDPPPRFWRCWTENRMPPSGITSWRSPLTCLKSCLLPPRILWIPFPGLCWTGWRSSSCPATPTRRRFRLGKSICFRRR